jgi:hypothetical protein
MMKMRDEQEILEMFNNLGEHDVPTRPPRRGLEETPHYSWAGDNFKYGYFQGKVAALAWVLGESNTADLNNNYDFEDFVAEQEARKRPPDYPTLKNGLGRQPVRAINHQEEQQY